MQTKDSYMYVESYSNDDVSLAHLRSEKLGLDIDASAKRAPGDTRNVELGETIAVARVLGEASDRMFERAVEMNPELAFEHPDVSVFRARLVEVQDELSSDLAFSHNIHAQAAYLSAILRIESALAG